MQSKTRTLALPLTKARTKAVGRQLRRLQPRKNEDGREEAASRERRRRRNSGESSSSRFLCVLTCKPHLLDQGEDHVMAYQPKTDMTS